MRILYGKVYISQSLQLKQIIMVAIINYKRCDRAEACPCIKVCPVGALYYDPERKRPVIDKSKCTNCGLCVQKCPAQVIRLARNEEEEQKILEEIERDKMTTQELFLERYGVPPGNSDFVVNKSNFEDEVLNAKDVILVDCWSFSQAPCRIKAIPFGDFIKGAEIRKLNVDENKDIAKQFSIHLYPTLLVFKNGKIIDRFEGQLLPGKVSELRKKIVRKL